MDEDEDEEDDEYDVEGEMPLGVQTPIEDLDLNQNTS